MKKHFKVISAILAAAMLISSIMTSSFVFAEDADTNATDTTTTTEEAAEVIAASTAAAAIASMPGEDLEYSSDYRFDSALGIFEMLPDGYWETEQVTRGEFSTIIAKMIKANTEGYPSYSTSPYSDINADHFAYPAVCYLTDVGILNGDGNAIFRPDDPILVSEAVKMVMAAIGYSEACEASGGFPTGYISWATRADVLNGLNNLDTNGTLTALQASRLVRNGLEANLMQAISYNNNGAVEVMTSNTTLLEQTYKVRKETAELIATYFATLSGAEVDLENEIILDNVTYQIQNNSLFDPEDYLGCKVDFYYMTNVSGYRRSVVIFVESVSSPNYQTTIQARDLVSVTDSQVNYIDENGRDESINIDDMTMISYNGKPLENIPDEGLTIQVGEVKVVSQESMGRADAVIINEMFDAQFERYNSNTEQVIFQNNATSNLPSLYFTDNYHTMITLNGEAIEPEDLQKGDVITYSVSNDGYYIRGYVSRDQVEGTVSVVSNDTYANGEYTVVTISNQDSAQDYVVSPYCSREITAGFSSAFQLTYDGRILGTNAVSSSGANYAYLIDFGTVDNGFNSSFVVKLMDRNGAIHEFNSAMKVNTNLGDSGDVTQVSADVICSQYASALSRSQVVLYELNSNSQIRSLYLATDYTDSLEDPNNLDFGMYYSGSTRLTNNLIANCAITSDTLIFRVPFADRNRESDYSVVTVDALENGGVDADIYDIRNGVANVLVVKDSDPANLSDSADVMFVDEVVSAWDEASATRVTQIVGYVNGEKVSYNVDEDATQSSAAFNGYATTIENAERGDLIQFTVGSNDAITIYRFLYDYSATDNYFELNQDGHFNYELGNDELYVVYGEVMSAYDFYLVETTDLTDKKYYRAYPTTDVNLYQYDLERDELTVGDPYDIQPGDRVVIRTQYNDEEIDMMVITGEE